MADSKVADFFDTLKATKEEITNHKDPAKDHTDSLETDHSGLIETLDLIKKQLTPKCAFLVTLSDTVNALFPLDLTVLDAWLFSGAGTLFHKTDTSYRIQPLVDFHKMNLLGVYIQFDPGLGIVFYRELETPKNILKILNLHVVN